MQDIRCQQGAHVAEAEAKENSMAANHRQEVESVWYEVTKGNGGGVIGEEEAACKPREPFDTELSGKGTDAVLSIALYVGEVFRKGNNGGKDGDKCGDEGDGATPTERQAESGTGGMVDTKIEKKAADSGDDREGGKGEAFQTERRDRVCGAKEEANRVQR